MNKRFYYPNTVLVDEKLPFSVQITTGLSVYIVSKFNSNTFVKPDAYVKTKRNWLLIEHEGYIITVKGFDPKTKKLVYDIKEPENVNKTI